MSKVGTMRYVEERFTLGLRFSLGFFSDLMGDGDLVWSDRDYFKPPDTLCTSVLLFLNNR